MVGVQGFAGEISLAQQNESRKSNEPSQTQSDIKTKCNNLESNLDPMFIGLVAEEIDGVRQIFAFLNYDYLETITQTPENAVQSGVVFCRNEDSEIYPITDTNTKSKLKWATVDELIFEKKILTDEVDANISKMFNNNDHLWNIQDINQNYIDFPFVVYAVNHEYKTLSVADDISAFLENGKIEDYGTTEKGDEYDARFCFTLSPLTQDSGQTESSIPRRIAMFAWKTRYVVTEEQLETQTGGEAPNNEAPNNEAPLDKEGEKTSDSNGVKDDKIANAKLDVPTIYTITNNEHINGSPVVMWGILNSKQFAAL